MTKNRIVKYAANTALLAVLAAAGSGVYQIGTYTPDKEIQKELQTDQSEDTEETPMVDADTSLVDAEISDTTGQNDTAEEKIARTLTDQNADFYLVQEVDIDSTRSYHVDEREPLYAALSWENSVFCQNYDSPYLMYPLTKPHGASRSGLLTFAPAEITSARRVELPVESGFMKLLDLDRCYSVSRIPVDGGRELVLYNLHLSAYTSDGTIATEQLSLLLRDMQREYEKGNWCVAGGDFNKDLLGDSAQYFGAADQAYSWAQPIPDETFDGFAVRLVAPLDEQNPVPSCRNADGPYHEGQYVLTVDGFLVSANVTVEQSNVIDTGFESSDHNPVQMTFRLETGEISSHIG